MIAHKFISFGEREIFPTLDFNSISPDAELANLCISFSAWSGGMHLI